MTIFLVFVFKPPCKHKTFFQLFLVKLLFFTFSLITMYKEIINSTWYYCEPKTSAKNIGPISLKLKQTGVLEQNKSRSLFWKHLGNQSPFWSELPIFIIALSCLNRPLSGSQISKSGSRLQIGENRSGLDM